MITTTRLTNGGQTFFLMNIMSCHGFSKVTTPTVILSCCSNVVTYYLSKGCIIVENVYGISISIPGTSLNKTNAYSLHEEDGLFTS